jgi:hypothetical protein
VPLPAPTSRRRVRVRLAAPWKGFVRCESVQSQRVLVQRARIHRRSVPGHRAHRREDDSILLIMPRDFHSNTLSTRPLKGSPPQRHQRAVGGGKRATAPKKHKRGGEQKTFPTALCQVNHPWRVLQGTTRHYKGYWCRPLIPGVRYSSASGFRSGNARSLSCGALWSASHRIRLSSAAIPARAAWVHSSRSSTSR